MAIIATGSKTIIDLSDGKSLSAYLGSNQPRTQIHDVNANTYQPNWTTTAGKLVITPVVYANQTAIALTNAALSITWKRREGSGSEAVLASGETVSGNVLTVSQNKLASVASGLLTYIAYVTYTDPDTGLPINATADITFALVSTGENAKSAWISGEQVFKYDKDSNVSPAQITLTANLQNVTMGKWQYKNSSGTWTDYPTTSDNASITAATLVVKPTHAIFVGSTASLRVTTSDSSIGDTTSIYKVQDGATGATGGTGAAGKNASVVFLTNENITFAGNASGVVTAVTKTCSVVAYTGTTKVTPTLGTISGAPTGMTVTAGSASGNEIPLTIAIAANSNLGGAGQLEGTISIPVTAPVSTTLQLRWSKVNTGATGSSAYVLTVYAPGGTVFTNGEANGSASITLNAQFFQGLHRPYRQQQFPVPVAEVRIRQLDNLQGRSLRLLGQRLHGERLRCGRHRHLPLPGTVRLIFHYVFLRHHYHHRQGGQLSGGHVVDRLADGVQQRCAAAGDILPFGQRLDPPDVDAVVDDLAKFQMYGWQQHIERCIRRRSMETASSPRPFPSLLFVRFQPKASGARTPRLSAAKLGDIGRYGAAIRRALARGFASHAPDKAPGECACRAQANVL